MNKFYPLLLLLLAVATANAQNAPQKSPVQPYGKVELADLEMKSCDFEPDANAEVLFDEGFETLEGLQRHIRIKIFNNFGKGAGNISLDGADNLQAETINLVNGVITITPLDKKQIYIEKSRFGSTLKFAMPDVRPGCIIEYKYKAGFNRTWYFQNRYPTRYSEVETNIPPADKFESSPHVTQPFVVNVGWGNEPKQIKALENIRSLPDEPFMTPFQLNLQRIDFLIILKSFLSWTDIADKISLYMKDDQRIDENTAADKEILKQVKDVKDNDSKINIIYNIVKQNLKWNGLFSPLPVNDPQFTWKTKSGSFGEINWLLYHFLKKAAVPCYPMFIADKNRTRLNPAIPYLFDLGGMVVYIPVDSAKSYVLDASNKYNLFNQIPKDELNSFGLKIDDGQSSYPFVFMASTEPSMQSVFINAQIGGDGKIVGTVERTSFSYNKIKAVQRYKTDGEEKYMKFLCDSDNNIKLTSIKLENMETDSLPLSLKGNFTMNIDGGSENYIYVKTNLFTALGPNPFKNENRFTDIDFGYRDNLSLSGIYKLPDGYKADVLPKNVTLVTPDNSILFKRMVAEENGTLVIRYLVDHRKTLYFSKDYADIHDFYKKMYEMLNEQIVLKKN